MDKLPFSYELIRSDRRTVAMQITPAGGVVLRCPRRMPREAAEGFLLEKQAWILAHLKKIQAVPAQPPLTWEELEKLGSQALQDLPERVRRFAPRVGVSYGRITIRNQKTRWGSCSSQGNLNFNCLLMLTPPEIRDYVVVHELCHRRHMDHSAAFWAEVEKVLPDWQKRRQWLKENGGALIGRLP